MIKTKYLIIGAGLTGLTLAKNLGEDYLILEKTNEIGGLSKSYYLGEFVFDCGGHFMHGFDLDKTNQSIIKVNKIAKVAFKQKFINAPFQNNVQELNEKDYKKCVKDFNKKHKFKPTNLTNYLYSMYGKTTVNLFLKPYNEKLYCTKLNSLDKNCFGRFFPAPNNKKNYNDEFIYDKLGCAHFFEKTFNAVDKSKIIFNCFYRSIDVKNKLVHTNKDVIKFEYLINTSPFNQFYKAINETDYNKNKKYLKANKVLVINIGFNKNSNVNFHWVYVENKHINFYRVGFYSNITKGDKLSIYAEVAFKENANINTEKEFKKVLRGLKQLGIIDDSFKVEQHNFVVCNPAYVHINKKSNELVSSFKSSLEKNNVYTIGRYGNWEYSSMIDNVKEAENLVLRIKGN